jgi:CMP-N-acetylneuraminic acid synthetase
MDNVLFFIPARGNSKGLPGKNIRVLHGKPLITWTIEAALTCGIKGRVVVSTDSNEIASVAKKSGAEVPWLRPDELAGDESSTMDAVIHFLNKEAESGYSPKHIVILQPTSPLRNAMHIKEAFELYTRPGVQSVVAVCQTEHHPYWCNTLPEDKSMDGFIRQEVMGMRRQDFPVYYRINGAIYIARVENVIQNANVVYGQSGKAYIMDRKSSVDIDTELDFIQAEFLMKEL